MPDKTLLDKIIDTVLQIIVPDKIILFGSQARGEARIDSDYDILIIKSGIENESKIEGDIYEKLYHNNVDATVDVIVTTPEIVEKYKNSIGCIIKPALKEGIVIYG